jgi:putative transposase
METTVTCKLKLMTSKEQEGVLMDSLVTYRDAMNFVWKENFVPKLSATQKIHDSHYYTIRERFSIPSQFACDVVRETHGVFASLWELQKKEKGKPEEKRRDHFEECPVRKSLTMQMTLNRTASVFPDSKTVHLTMKDGRLKSIPFQGWDKHILYLRSGRIGDPKLTYDRRKKSFYLLVPVTMTTFDVPHRDVVGIDIGERHFLAVVSTAGTEEIVDLPDSFRENKAKIHLLREALRSKGTRSANRHLTKLGKRERLFTSDLMHCVAKGISDQFPEALIVMEDLTDIRDSRKTFRGGKTKEERMEKRRQANQWSFAEFRTKLTYKHSLHNGGRVESVDPAYTSQTCPQCGHVCAENRIGDEFLCLNCGHHDHADLNAAKNILSRSLILGSTVNRPIVPAALRQLSKPTTSVVGS